MSGQKYIENVKRLSKEKQKDKKKKADSIRYLDDRASHLANKSNYYQANKAKVLQNK